MDDIYSLFDLEDMPVELSGLSKAIRYGHSILTKLTELESLHYEEITVITLFRKLLENADGVFILADNGSVTPTTTVARAAYEVFLQIEFIFKEEKEINRKALSYYSTWLYEEIVFIEQQLKGTSKTLLPKKVLLAKLKSNNELLNNSFPSFKEEINRTKRRLKIKHSPKWYSLYNGPKNLGQLSKETSVKEAHAILYKGMSAEAHGIKSITNISKHSKELDPIRIDDISQLPIGFVRSFITSSTIKIVKKYLPSEFHDCKQVLTAILNSH